MLPSPGTTTPVTTGPGGGPPHQSAHRQDLGPSWQVQLCPPGPSRPHHGRPWQTSRAAGRRLTKALRAAASSHPAAAASSGAYPGPSGPRHGRHRQPPCAADRRLARGMPDQHVAVAPPYRTASTGTARIPRCAAGRSLHNELPQPLWR
jgi:hypothetical protein